MYFPYMTQSVYTKLESTESTQLYPVGNDHMSLSNTSSNNVISDIYLW